MKSTGGRGAGIERDEPGTCAERGCRRLASAEQGMRIYGADERRRGVERDRQRGGAARWCEKQQGSQDDIAHG